MFLFPPGFALSVFDVQGFSVERLTPLGILFAVDAVSIILLLCWKKLGFWLLLISFVAKIPVGMGIGMTPVHLISVPVWLAALWGLLNIRKNGCSAWNYMNVKRNTTEPRADTESANNPLEKELKTILEKNTNLEKEFKIMQEKNMNLATENEEIKQRLRNFDLVSDAINARPDNHGHIAEFQVLLDNDFSNSIAGAVFGANDAVALKKMEKVRDEMTLIAQCRTLHSKSIGAIGGGFSSGKSSFINSFLDGSKSNIKLAEGINPVTVIPSYVVCGEDSHVDGISFKGRRFDIAIDMYNSLSHDYVKKSFPFELNRIIFYTTVQTPMKTEYFENLCLIDTPGYNPPSAGNTRHDFENAKRYIEKAAFLIWMVGLDSNGTFPKSDIEFLEQIDLFGSMEGPQLYVVANKAGLKKPEDIEDILDNFAESLDDYNISYAGISAYDSKEKKQFAYRKKDLFEFLAEHNKPSEKYVELKKILHEVFTKYVGELNSRYNRHSDVRKQINTLKLDALQSGNISIDNEASSSLEDGLNKLLHNGLMTKEEFEKNLATIRATRDKFMDCLRGFCETMGIACNDVTFCQECGKPFGGGGDVCQECAGKTCPDCGSKWPSDNIFCTDCGRRL